MIVPHFVRIMIKGNKHFFNSLVLKQLTTLSIFSFIYIWGTNNYGGDKLIFDDYHVYFFGGV